MFKNIFREAVRDSFWGPRGDDVVTQAKKEELSLFFYNNKNIVN